jgi:hypothetical protein
MTRNLSTAFHAEMDGQMEWVNAIIEQYLQAYLQLPTGHLDVTNLR